MGLLRIDRELDEIFDACLDRMAAGESIEECLRDHPRHRDRLQPLLQAAESTIAAAAAVRPSPPAKARGLARLREHIESGSAPSSPRWWRVMANRRLAFPMTAALFVALIVLGGGSIAAVVADDSVPGDDLYWVKRTKESVVLTLSRSDAGKAQTHAQLAGVRGAEMRTMLEQGRVSAAERHLDAVNGHLRASAQHAGVVVSLSRIEMPPASATIGDDSQLIALVFILEQDSGLLRVAALKAPGAEPEEQRRRIERLIRDFELSYRALVSALYPDAASGPFWRFETIGIQSSIR